MTEVRLDDTQSATGSAMVYARKATDEQLARDARSGELHAFEAIMRRYNQRFFRLARSVTATDSDAEDALQDAYVRAFTNLESFEGRSTFSTWLSRIVLNEALGRTRRGQREREQFSQIQGDRLSNDDVVVPFDRDAPENPEALAERGQVRGLIEQAINRLPEGFRSVFVLRVVEQLSIEETAKILQIPEATVKTRTHRAKQQMKAQLQDMIDDALDDTFTFLGKRCDRTVARVLERLTLRER
ncbi:RNA polymerase sigma factor [Pelagibius sp. Alg239-R121]|uniref:RNA polymerase sigma factor n=1 Tax=Pelagibius sp. Alg239-R121 TaxID=2993448 RepID=UPI0024A72DCF|nr:RNA polymerase sigma factor [Pelagibius sp. Alg239-R121]